MPEMDSTHPTWSRNILPAFFLSRLGSEDTIEHTGCTFLGHRHKWVVATMGNFLPSNQPQAAALGIVINNSEVDSPSTLTWMSTDTIPTGNG